MTGTVWSQFGIWGYMFMEPSYYPTMNTLSKLFFAAVSLAAAIGFLVYGGR